MRILIVHRAIQREGGAENQIARLTERYVARGHHVTIVTAIMDRALWYADHYERLGVPVIETGLPRPWLPIFKGFWPMRRALRRFPFHEYDVVNLHNYPSYWHATLVPQGKSRPVVTWTCNEAAPEIWYYSDYAITRSVRTTLRRALWRGFWLTLMRPFERRAMRAMDRIYVLSEAEREFLRRDYDFDALPMGSGVDVTESHASPDEASLSEVRARYDIRADRFNLLCAPLDLPVAADILRDLPPLPSGERAGVRRVRLHVLGQARPRVMRQVQAALGGRVQFLGHVPREDLQGIYATVDLGLFARQYYPWGLVVAEMMACETPVLAFRAGARRYMIQDGVTGFLVDTREEFAARVRALADAPDVLGPVGQQARAWVIANCTWDLVAKRYLADFETLLARRERARGKS